jgi:sugar lactone lactonase YvrE
MPHPYLLLATLLATAPLAAQQDSTWRDHDRAARDARLRGDWAASRAHLERMDATLTGHPAIIVALARASAQLRDTTRVLAELERLAAEGLSHDVEADTQLAIVRRAPGGAAVMTRLRANLAPAGTFTAVATMPEPDFVAEGIVWDESRQRLLVSSIRRRRIDAVRRDGTISRFIDLTRDSDWSPRGLAIDARRNRLWAATEWSPLAIAANPADSGRTAILQYDLASGTIRRRYELPRGGNAHEPGDVGVAPNGDLFVSDGRAGVVYVIREGSTSLDTLVRAGPLVSPQGLAPDRDGQRVFVADYALGIVAVDRRTGAVARLPRPRDVAANGVDGLVLHDDQLIGVQNGVTPNRVVAFDLDPTHSRIIGARTLARDTTRIREPTHLVAVGDDIFYIANGGFGLYDERGSLRPGVTQVAPVVARLKLRPPGR